MQLKSLGQVYGHEVGKPFGWDAGHCAELHTHTHTMEIDYNHSMACFFGKLEETREHVESLHTHRLQVFCLFVFVLTFELV